MTENISPSPARLYRSRTDRYLGGICGGLGEYFNVNSNLIRILFVVLTVLEIFVAAVYVAAFFLVPENPDETTAARSEKTNSPAFWGVSCIAVGGFLMLKEWGFFWLIHWKNIPWQVLGAIVLIIIGILLLVTYRKPETESSSEEKMNNWQFRRSRTNKQLGGICGAIGIYLDLDPAVIRLGWVFISLLTAGIGLLVYLLLWLLLPEEDATENKI